MRAQTKWRLIRFSITSIALFGLWLLFTSSLTTFYLIAGFLGAALIAALTFDVFIPQHQANLHFTLPNPLFLVMYMGKLVGALYGSSWKMLQAIVTGDVQPRIVYFRTRLRSDLARMALANSITLTPGTITLDLNDDHLIVHWFFCTTHHTKAAGEEIKGKLEAAIQKVWL